MHDVSDDAISNEAELLVTGQELIGQLTQKQLKEHEQEYKFFLFFVQTISIAPFQVHYYSEVLPTQHGIALPKRHRQLRVEDLPKVPTWRPERDLNQAVLSS